MISCATFLESPKKVSREPDINQRQAVEADKGDALFVAAGPGTGKMTTCTMQMLKLIYVDGVAQRGILTTTFTQGPAVRGGLARALGSYEFLSTEKGGPLNSQGLEIVRSSETYDASFNPR